MKVSKEVDLAYRNLLIEKLANPEDWQAVDSSKAIYKCIIGRSNGHDIVFRFEEVFCSKVNVYDDYRDTIIYTIKIPMFNKIRNMIDRVRTYKENEVEIRQIKALDTQLISILPENYMKNCMRGIKLNKIRNKI